MSIEHVTFLIEITGAAALAGLFGWLIRGLNRNARRGGGNGLPSWLAAAAFLCMAVEAVANLIWRSPS